MKFSKLLGEFQDVFAWSYEDIRGFDPALIHHAIPIKEGIKLVRKKQIPINLLALDQVLEILGHV
jgi:hypothetical protein